MKFFSPLALTLATLPLLSAAASAQTSPSSITSFDRFGNPIIQYTSPTQEDIDKDGLRSSVTTFDRDGTPIIRYTAPPLNPSGITQPQSVAGLIANQNIYGQSAPIGNYGSYGYGGGYYAYPGYSYTPPPYRVQLGDSIYGPANANSLTVIPLTPEYAYPVPVYPYPVPVYPYGVPAYPYPTYGYPAAGYAYGNGTYASQSTGYGVRFGAGGLNFSFGGSNYSSSRSTTITPRIIRNR